MSLKLTSQSGYSLTSLVIGIAMSLISTAAAYNFYLKNQRLTSAIEGESEAMLHLSILLKQTFRRFPPNATRDAIEAMDDANALCLQLASGDFKFKNLKPGDAPQTVTSKTWSPNKAFLINGVKEASSGSVKGRTGYKIERLSIVQKSPIIGRGPSRVVADLVVVVNLKGTAGAVENSSRGLDDEVKGNKKLRTLVVPMLLELNAAGKPFNCMDKPTPEDMCKENGLNMPNPKTQNCGGT